MIYFPKKEADIMNGAQWQGAMEKRHSVRSYLTKPIGPDALAALTASIKQYNQASGLRIQLVTNEPKAFSGLMAHYGHFSGVRNYIALAAPEIENRETVAGYYGEKLVLEAQTLGLSTCWVALTYSKRKCPIIINPGDKLICVIAIGYGISPGRAHKSRPAEELSNLSDASPDWFRRGVEAALLAPTAVNQQSFYLAQEGDSVALSSKGGPCSRIDLGIVKLHFELGAGKENFVWKEV